jgi:hypothetical protein
MNYCWFSVSENDISGAVEMNNDKDGSFHF